MTTARYLTNIDQITQLSAEERERLKQVTDKFPFRTNDYYLSLIDWDDPNDPIRRIAIPDPDELQEWGELDASGEAGYTGGFIERYVTSAVYPEGLTREIQILLGVGVLVLNLAVYAVVVRRSRRSSETREPSRGQ